MALYLACFVAVCRRLNFSSPLFAWSAASIWVLLEWVQNWMLSGFPWQLLGYSQYLNLPFLQWAAITGVYGLSFLIVLFNAALAQALSHRAFIRYLSPASFSCWSPFIYGASIDCKTRRILRPPL